MTFVVVFLLDQPERATEDMQRIRVGDSVFCSAMSARFGRCFRVI